MGLLRPVEEVKLFVALLSNNERLFDITRESLSQSFGPVDIVSPTYQWNHSTYYEMEMGTDLKRTFLFFERPIQPQTLADIKIITNELEEYYSNNTGASDPIRSVNIDPGYLTLAKVVLASTKDYAHRIYIGKGIYAEVTLYYMDKTYQPLPYTYPDYRSKEYITMFNMARAVMEGNCRIGSKG
jgi:hypothetical protein